MIELKKFIIIVTFFTLAMLAVAIIGRVGVAVFFYFFTHEFDLTWAEIYICLKAGLIGGGIGGSGVWAIHHFKIGQKNR
ncbi:hypothetical protein [Yersinia mollaretii]|uniref:hypothetical protein n=1 Tax=Yersinia mollaretii TaxID=33060 RepID=UPI00119F98CD|nr:hypothetical protein [Yersinia mollaretii]